MLIDVVDACAYKNYADAITWPLIRLINACQCLGARINIFFSIEMRLVNSVHIQVT